MGLIAWDVKGIIYGPLVVCITLIFYDLIIKFGTESKSLLMKLLDV